MFDYAKHLLVSTLETHHSWVRDLKWCHNSPFYHLVSVGDRVAWWDLNPPRSGSRGGLCPPTLTTPAAMSHLKTPSVRGPIQTFEFQGRCASKLFVSPDGRVVVTVTDSGILYILRQLADH